MKRTVGILFVREEHLITHFFRTSNYENAIQKLINNFVICDVVELFMPKSINRKYQNYYLNVPKRHQHLNFVADKTDRMKCNLLTGLLPSTMDPHVSLLGKS